MESFESEYKKLLNQVSNYMTELKKNINKGDNFLMERKVYLSEIKNLELLINEDKQLLESFDPEIETTKEQLSVFEEKSDQLKMLQIMTLKSSLWPRTFNKIQRITTEVQCPVGIEGKMSIAIMKYTEYQNHFKNIVKCKTINDFEKSQFPLIYFDGVTQISNVIVTKIDKEMKGITKIHVEAKRDFQFVVLCLSDVKVISNTRELITHFFDNRIDSLQCDKQSTIQRIDLNGKSKEEKNDRITMIFNDLSITKKNILQIHNHLHHTQGNASVIQDNFTNQLSINSHEAKRLLESERFQLTEKICKILIDSNIEVHDFQRIRDVRIMLEKIDTDTVSSQGIINNLTNNVLSRISIEGQEVLIKIDDCLNNT
jgi:hypothetical protein